MLVVAGLAVVSCAAPPTLQADDDRTQVVTTTALLQDLVRQVGGDRVNVSTLVPANGDPHSYEPSLRDIRNVVYADLAFSNYLLLEQQGIVKALDANLPSEVPNVSLAEGAVKYAAEIIQLVENVSLDTIWLGMRVRGTGDQHGATRASDIFLSGTTMEGPGSLTAYLTESFGNADIYLDSSDGFNAADGFRDDTADLPPDAHTHMSWAFTEPGVYRLSMQGRLAVEPGSRPIPLGEETFTFAVGIDPYSVPDMDVKDVLDGGHADIAVDLDRSELFLYADPEGGGNATQEEYDAATTVISVPPKAFHEIPPGPSFRFLGEPGDSIYQLPQAVLGKHVHGEIDPHLWQNVRNAISYVELMRDELTEVDPAGALEYQNNAAAYIAELERLDAYVASTIGEIPEAQRNLVTTHDAFGYLGDAYGMEISGFVTPNPSTEPSLLDRRKLSETIRTLDIPAVFLEPNLAARSSTLTELAGDQGIEICPIYGDTFDDEVTSYVEMMRFNANSLLDCLGT